MKSVQRFVLVMAVCLLAACASWRPGYEKPEVNITSFSLAPESAGTMPRFLIGLQVINPNRGELALKGISYQVDVEGHRILSGASADLPVVPAYGMADFVIEASPNLLGSMRLINQLVSGQKQQLDYRFRARLDVGTLLPYITLSEQGSFGMGQTP